MDAAPGQAASGTLLHVDIPGAASGFQARPAAVWLPPAALVDDPPALPVMILLSGQPGTPDDVLAAGMLQDLLERYQAEHRGIAPIVVSPDQLGEPAANPMCVDSVLGASRTYLEQDVVTWIRGSLPVAADRSAWTFGGFSQGATCTMQIGLADQARYGTAIAISPELYPSLDGDLDRTVALAFGGDRAAFDAASPASILAANAPYRDTALVLGTGEQDALFTTWGDVLADDAAKAGIAVARVVSPGTSHDFNTVSSVLREALPIVAARAGIA